MSVKDKILAGIIAFIIFGFFIALAWITRVGGFKIVADVLQNPNLLVK